jgi:hypothetical protein
MSIQKYNIIVVQILILLLYTVTAAQYQIRQVHVVTRHGDRTPLYNIPNIERVVWNCQLPNDIQISPYQSTNDGPLLPFLKVIQPHGGQTFLEIVQWDN